MNTLKKYLKNGLFGYGLSAVIVVIAILFNLPKLSILGIAGALGQYFLNKYQAKDETHVTSTENDLSELAVATLGAFVSAFAGLIIQSYWFMLITGTLSMAAGIYFHYKPLKTVSEISNGSKYIFNLAECIGIGAAIAWASISVGLFLSLVGVNYETVGTITFLITFLAGIAVYVYAKIKADANNKNIEDLTVEKYYPLKWQWGGIASLISFISLFIYFAFILYNK